MAKKKTEDEGVFEEALSGLREKYGNDVIMHGEDTVTDVETISSGSLALDNLLGCGGLPRGRIIEIYGEPSSGKTATTLFLISQIQKAGGRCVFIDAEHAFNSSFASVVGVDVKKLFVSQPGSLEEAMDTIRAFASTNKVDLIVVDSVPALVPKSEIDEDEMLKDTMAVQARLMGKALRILTGEVARSRTVVIFINHLKDKIGVFYGEKTTTPGGKALKFYSSVRLSVARGEKFLGSKQEQIGNAINITAVKNKVGFPWKKCSVDLYYKDGIDLYADALDTGIEVGIVEKSGNTYSYKGKTLGVGREKAKTALLSDSDAFEGIKKDILAVINKKDK